MDIRVIPTLKGWNSEWMKWKNVLGTGPACGNVSSFSALFFFCLIVGYNF